MTAKRKKRGVVSVAQLWHWFHRWNREIYAGTIPRPGRIAFDCRHRDTDGVALCAETTGSWDPITGRYTSIDAIRLHSHLRFFERLALQTLQHEMMHAYLGPEVKCRQRNKDERWLKLEERVYQQGGFRWLL
jgi:hypothetical protein